MYVPQQPPSIVDIFVSTVYEPPLVSGVRCTVAYRLPGYGKRTFDMRFQLSIAKSARESQCTILLFDQLLATNLYSCMYVVRLCTVTGAQWR